MKSKTKPDCLKINPLKLPFIILILLIHILLIFPILTFALNSPVNCSSVLNMINLYHLDTGTGDDIIDSCGYINGTRVNANWVTGLFNNSLFFDGDGDYVVNNMGDIWAGKNRTIFAWIKINQLNASNNKLILARHESLYKKSMEMGIVGDKIMFSTYSVCSSGSPTILLSSITLQKDKWYFITYVLKSGISKEIYINGILDASSSSVPYFPSGCGLFNTSIGSNLRNGDTSFNGTIDDVGIINGTLNSTQVFNLYKLYDNTPPNYTIIIPQNNTNSTNYTIDFFINLTDNLDLKNVSLYIYNSSDDLVFSNSTTLSGVQDFFSNVYKFITTGVYELFYKVYDSVGNFINTAIYTLNILQPNPIVVNITFPQNTTYNYILQNLNYSFSGTLDACLYSKDKGITNYSFVCGNPITDIFSSNGSNTWTIYMSNSIYSNFSEVSFESIFLCDNTSPTLIVSSPSYPYVDLNSNFTFKVGYFDLGISNIKMNITSPIGNFSITNRSLNYNSTAKTYQTSFVFNKTGDYSFVIYGDNECPTIQEDITGNLLVRNPYYVNIKVFGGKTIQEADEYINDFAYVTAEFTDGRHYDDTLENYITPLVYKRTYDIPVFWGEYEDGEATIKLYEPNKTYAYRLVDGIINFPEEYSVPNMTKSYGTNFFLGRIYHNGTNEDLWIYSSPSEIHQYRALFNWIFIIGLGFAIIISIFLAFVIPEHPTIALTIGVLSTIMLIIFRIGVWFVWGW